MRLTMSDRKAVIKAWSSQYRKVGKKEKGRILDELVALTGYSRCYVVNLLRWDGKVIRAGRRVRLIGDLRKKAKCTRHRLYDERGSIPIAYQLYLPKEWATDTERRESCGVPDNIVFATKPEIALEQMRQAIAAGVRMGVVLTDAGYGDETAFRDGITELGMIYAVGIRPSTTVWAPGAAQLPPKAWPGHGRRPTKLRREPGSEKLLAGHPNEPVAVKALALALSAKAWRTVTWREGTNSELSSRFAVARVRPAHRDYLRPEMRPEKWLLVE